MAGTRKAGRKKQPAKQRRSRAHAKTAPARHKRELAEERQRLAATAEILRIISSSPAEPQPVFDAIANSARKLLGGRSAVVVRRVDDVLYLAALTATTEAGDKALREMLPAKLTGESFTGKAVLSGKPMWVSDIETDPAYSPAFREGARQRGIRSHLAVPMVSKGSSIGAIIVGRRDPGTFSGHEISLLQTFAEQAVIAIENARLFNETKEALEQQTATAEILKVISGSPTEVQPVFDAIVRSAARLFHPCNTGILMVEGKRLTVRGLAVSDPASRLDRAALAQLFPRPIGESFAFAKAITERRIVEVPETQRPDFPQTALAISRALDTRSVVLVPLIRDDVGIGVLALASPNPGVKLTPSQRALLRTFADQAVIAIENTRLFNETKEALERQTATAEVLRVISGSLTDTQPVFDIIAERAARLTGATFGWVFTYDGEWIRAASSFGLNPDAIDAALKSFPMRPGGGSYTARAIRDQQVVNVADALAETDPEYVTKPVAAAAGYRSVLSVPMFREQQVVGAISVNRADVGRFSEKEVALLRMFADQAVIAIENVRLFNETKEALERQTATAEILEVMSRSQTDLQPVFDTIAANAMRLCDGDQGLVFSYDGELVHIASIKAMTPEGEAATRRAYPAPADLGSMTGRAIVTRATAHSIDVLEERGYGLRGEAKIAGWRSMLSVPMLRAGEPIGAITVIRRQPAAFSENQIALLKTFADQAVIAIENVRLFNETKEALGRQTATAEVLKAISQSTFDLQRVLTTLVENATRLCEASHGFVFLPDGATYRLAVAHGASPEFEAHIARIPVRPERGYLIGRAVIERRPVQIVDALADPDYRDAESQRLGGYRTMVGVPMLKGGEVVGVIVVWRQEVRAFSDKQIELLTTFADQAVIAIENVRLFNETKEALEQQTATADILRVISSTPTDVQPVFDAIVESALRVFSGMRVGILLDEGDQLRVVAAGGELRRIRKGLTAPRSRDSASGTALLERRVVNVRDIEAPDAPPTARDNGRADGFRAMAAAPLMREGEAIGTITVFLKEPGGLSDKQLALLETFADQAVIAIENTRLFRELEARTEALSKSVGQLKALGEVGQAIGSTLDFEKVLQTIVERAVELTGLDGGAIYEYEEDRQVFHLRSAENYPEELISASRRAPLRLGEGAVGLAGLTREAVQVGDILEEGYQSHVRELLISAGWRALLAVPLLREGRILGGLAVARGTPGPFAPEVVELLGTFATQSAIAIQNARLFREIEEKGRQLEIASRHKSDFLASMSHELRTPLNAILGFNEMILEGVYGEVPADMAEPLADIQTSGRHLLRLINNVLDLAKIEAGRMELALADYAVQDVVESVRATLRPLAEAKGLEFLASVPQDVPPAHGDAGRLTQCLMNLAGNSLKFTKAGRVSITVEQNGGGTLLWRVADTGIGIPPDKIGSLFTEFRQSDATIASEYGGTGLGLSITRKFVEMHGGRIWVESEPGQGSVFIFEVPLRTQSA